MGIRVVIVVGILLACCPCASALKPSLEINQFAHTAWQVREGFFKGTITSIAQTQDGYLWVGTEFGLLRFDGDRYVPWQPPPNQHLPNSYIRALLAARDGTLWIGTSEGLANWDHGKLTRYAELAGQSVFALLEDHEGTVWAGGHAAPAGRLCAIHRGNIQCYGGDGSFGQYVDSLYEDHSGNLWVGAITGLWRWKPGPPKFYPMPDRVQALAEGDNGALVVAMLSGIRRFSEGKLDAYPLPSSGQPFKARSILRDRDGGLWVGTTNHGIVHVYQGRMDAFERSDGLSSDFIEMLFEDREGDIWAATLDGLDRFRELTVPTISVRQGLSNATVKSVLAAGDGSVWLGTADGLNRWSNGRVTVYRKKSAQAMRQVTGLPDDAIESLFEDFQDRIWVSTRSGVAFFAKGRFTPVNSVPGEVHSIAGDRAGNIWIGQDQSLFHLRGRSVVEQVPWSRLGHQDPARALVADPISGGLWIAFRDGGVAFFQGGQVRASYTPADGLAAGHIRDIQLDRQGTLWVSAEGGLSRLQDGHFATLTSKNGLPCDAVHWATEDDDHSLWLYMACGLVHLTRSELDAWLATASKDPERRLQAAVFDSSDGVRSHTTSTGYSPSVAKSTDGKLWFLPWDGVSVIDPRHLPFNNLPPPVHIDQITADRKTHEAASNLRLPPLVHDLEIDYTALSLVAPEKIRFRVKLEGHDADWQEVGNRRQAFYDDLPPRQYRFRVAACNNSGVWNEAGSSFDFSIDPAYYQTTWFRLSSAAAFLALLAALYQLRLRYLKHDFNIRLEARVGERTRIARDFHDTTLQNFQGVLLKFSAVTHLIPERPDVQKRLEGVCDEARQAIGEGRDAVQGLRSSTVVANDLARAISILGEGLAADQTGQNCPEFGVHVEGKSRDLPPLVRDEVYQIACESLRNAFRHAQARRIEVEFRYDARQFRLRVLDNGKGIDPAVLNTGGRAGHHGLPGINERAKLAGGKLSVWSLLDSGTEIELTIPASIAYTKSPPARRSMSAGKGS